MNELEKKFSQYRAAAELKLGEAKKAIEADDLELAQSHQDEAAVLAEKAKMVKGQIDQMKTLGDLELEETAPPAKSADPVRPPFSTEPKAQEIPGDKSSEYDKAIYQVRFGDENSATKAIVRDLYGGDYNQKRLAQVGAFNKYIRYGERRMTAADENLLKTLILLPQSVQEEVQSGRDVRTIKADLQEMVNDLGGYLVPEDYRVDILSRLMGLTVVRRYARKVTTNRDAVEWPTVEGGNDTYTSAVRVTWVEEIPSSATAAATNPKFGMKRVPVHTVMARCDLSKNLLEDSAFDVAGLLAEQFSEAMAMDEDAKFITGTGGGTPRGILAKSNGTAPDDGVGSVVSGDASALTADGMINLVYGLGSQYRSNAVLIGARNTHRDLRKLKDGESRYMWEPSMQVGEPAAFLGVPILETENMPAVGATNYPLIYGDLRGYLIVDRVGMSVERVQDADTAGKNKVAFFARRRLGGEVIEPYRIVAHQVSAS